MQIANGYMLQALGYEPPMYIILVLLVISLLYIVIPHCLIETVEFNKVPVTFLKRCF